MFQQSEAADRGGLLTYSPNRVDLYRRAATYVDKILKGAKPADLPIEQPTTFDFVVNLKTAQALGLTIPPTQSCSRRPRSSSEAPEPPPVPAGQPGSGRPWPTHRLQPGPSSRAAVGQPPHWLPGGRDGSAGALSAG